MLTNDDIKIIRNLVKEEVTDAVSKAVAPLVTKEEAKKFSTKNDLKVMEKKLMRAIKREHKYQGEVLNYCEKEDRRINDRVDKLQKFVGMPVIC